MLKKLLFTLILITTAIITVPVSANEDFTQMTPTVQITSYKALYTGQILAIASGSGTVISKDGLVITNNHVVYNDNEQKPLDAFAVCITFDVQKEPVCRYTASLIANDKNLDIALLKIADKDVFESTVPDLKYLNYQTSATPKEKSQVQVVGYPASGGNTVTISKGQISGFEKYNNYNYFKTDTDFDHGSSGGTALDDAGNFIGIPTYIQTYAENVGYFLDIREATTWIVRAIHESPQQNDKATERLTMELARLEKANDDKKFSYDDYPKLSVTAPTGWKFQEISDNGLYMEQEKLTEAAGLSIYLNSYQYEIDKRYLDKLDEELSKYKQNYPDYKKESIKFNGYDAFRITYTYFNQRQYSIYIPYGYNLIGLSYAIILDEEEKQTVAIQSVLDTIKINAPVQKDPKLPTGLTFEKPAFSVTMPENWRIKKNASNQPVDMLAEAVQNNNFEGYLYFYYRQSAKDERELSGKERAEEAVKNLGGDSKLIYKKEDVKMDGLSGFLYTYQYEGDDYQEMRKRLSITLQDDKFEFVILYDDLSDTFDGNLEDIKMILNSVGFKGTGEHDFGSLTYRFNDIQYHRFASDISDLADKGIVSGYADGSFQPEKKVSRAEALKMILESKNHLEEERDLGKKTNFAKFALQTSPLKDVTQTDWFNKYVSYALEKKIIAGYDNKTFRPENTVNLTEALKIIIGTYEIPLWQGKTEPWYKVYMDKAYELGLLPWGVETADRLLTRAELCSIVNEVYNQAK